MSEVNLLPFFQQSPISDEVLINIKKEDIKDKNSEQYKHIESMPEDMKELFRKNGVSINGQQQIINVLENELESKYDLISWTTFPKYRQLEYIIGLAWNNLIKDGETTSPMTKAKLVKVTFDYGNDQDIARLVKSNFLYFKTLSRYENKDDREILDEAIRDAFQTLKHWFQYKIPKWLRLFLCKSCHYTPVSIQDT